jgi:tRNA dimethylallyltransferase
MGPTASGKTDCAIALQDYLPIEIISVDSTLVYKSLDIGSGKPSHEILEKHPHFLVDILDPSVSYSAGTFREDALHLMSQITARGNIPLLVGGTMLYFKSLLSGFADLPVRDDAVRLKLEELAKQYGTDYLHQQLQLVDPVSAKRIHANDFKRLQRALEIFECTGQSMSYFLEKQTLDKLKNQLPYQLYQFALMPLSEERKNLHQRIADRFNHMLKAGFVDEVAELYRREDLSLDLPSIRSVGYQQAWRYLSGEYDYAEMVERALIATRQLAKHQLTWLRTWPDVISIDYQEGDIASKILNYF